MSRSEDARIADQLVAGERLAVADLAAATLTDVYTSPSYNSNISVMMVNRTAANVTIRVGWVQDGMAASVVNTDYLIFDSTLAANATLMIDNITLDTDDTIIAQSSAVDVHCLVFGGES